MTNDQEVKLVEVLEVAILQSLNKAMRDGLRPSRNEVGALLVSAAMNAARGLGDDTPVTAAACLVTACEIHDVDPRAALDVALRANERIDRSEIAAASELLAGRQLA